MGYKNALLLMLIYLSVSSFGWAYRSGNTLAVKKWIISKNSNLSVNGTTNVNKFSCVIPTFDQTDTLTWGKSEAGTDVKLSGSIGLSINSFDCHNSGMTKQLRKTLNEQKYPVLYIRFLSLNKVPGLTLKPAPVTGFVEIEIAGVSKRYEVKYQIIQIDPKNIHMLGSRDINFSDFKLTPPTKLGGMIKTKDLLTVDFQLNMKAMD